MARLRVVTPEGVVFGVPGVGYESEMEALGPVGAAMVEMPLGSEEDFVGGRWREPTRSPRLFASPSA